MTIILGREVRCLRALMMMANCVTVRGCRASAFAGARRVRTKHSVLRSSIVVVYRVGAVVLGELTFGSSLEVAAVRNEVVQLLLLQMARMDSLKLIILLLEAVELVVLEQNALLDH